MHFGHDLRLPEDLLFNQPPDAPLAPEEYIKQLQAQMEEMHHLARKRIGMASEKMKTRYNESATGHNFHEGNKVWIMESEMSQRTLSKAADRLGRSLHSPKKTELRCDADTEITTLKKLKVIHYNILALYLGQDVNKTHKFRPWPLIIL
ncbi:retrovirus-related Pol polyprotein from transposon 412 [Trichonephila clavipes]|nr:retrovirus-related Pol polyprotein from transposon 412 [Trichonephila clavipes]